MSLLRIILLFVMAHLGFLSARMTGSLYALANGASTFTVGVIIALFSLVPMLIAVRVGRWLDAVGPRRPTLIGLATWCSAGCCCRRCSPTTRPTSRPCSWLPP